MQSDCCFCEYCQEKNENHTGLNFQDGQWLEELGELIEAAVEGARKGHSHRSLAAA